MEYCQYLLSSQVNYTLTNYAEHVTHVSHDLVKLYLERDKLTTGGVWTQVKTDIVASDDGYVVFDDTVLDKTHSRLAKSWDTDEKYQAIRDLNWSSDEIDQGKKIRLKGMPEHLAMKMFSVAVSPNRTDFVVTNDTLQHCSDDTKKICAIRWFVEQFHREIKQITGIDKCQCRKKRIQRNHIACAIQVWVVLKKLAYKTGQTVYQIKKNLMKNYLINELSNPSVVVSFS